MTLATRKCLDCGVPSWQDCICDMPDEDEVEPVYLPLHRGTEDAWASVDFGLGDPFEESA